MEKEVLGNCVYCQCTVTEDNISNGALTDTICDSELCEEIHNEAIGMA